MTGLGQEIPYLAPRTIPLRLFRTAEQLNVSVSHHSLHLRGMWKYGVDLGTLRNIMDAADITVLNYGLKWHRDCTHFCYSPGRV